MKTDTTRLGQELDDGTLEDWVKRTVNEVKSKPSDIALRQHLFNLYCLQAEWAKAMRQVETLLQLEPEFKRQGELYKNLILSEKIREGVLAGQREPGTVEDSQPEWIKDLLQANALYAENDLQQGETLRRKVLDVAEARSGQSEHKGEFNWLADGDDRLGPVCEFICAGGYRWVPFAHLEMITVQEPQQLIDLIWAPAQIIVNGKSWHGYLPSRYPVSLEEDDAFKLGQKTEWRQVNGERYCGVGRKMWVTSEDEFSLFEAGKILFN